MDCEEYCECQNGATCNKINGTCYCLPGFTGTFCESNCTEDTYGNNCENECHCRNGATCGTSNGTCECPPGYFGDFCENKCWHGNYGQDCAVNCSCVLENTEFCSHIDGYCSCAPGYTGVHCERKCPLGKWGMRCEGTCECQSSSTCDHASGFCDCPLGWRGSHCNESCPPDRFGKNCMESCRCIKYSTCDPKLGNCSCLPGWMGRDCSIICPEGMFGLYCNFYCDCPQNLSCDPENGKCFCDSDHNNRTCKKGGFFAENSNNNQSVVIIVTVGLIIIGFGTISVISFYVVRKIKYYKDSSLYTDNNSVTSMGTIDASKDFNASEFTNPIYGQTIEIDRDISSTRPKVLELISSVTRLSGRLSKNESNELSFKINRLSDSPRSKHFVSLGFDPNIGNVQSKESHYTAKYHKNEHDDSEASKTDDTPDKVSLYKISIYDDVRNPEDSHYDKLNHVATNDKQI